MTFPFRSCIIFQSTPPRGGDGQCRPSPCGAFGDFNPRPRVGATRSSDQRGQNPQHFNPRPRVGATQGIPVGCGGQHISIHAPAWGRPSVILLDFTGHTISIHAPAWGRLISELALDLPRFLFQSTPPRGRDSLRRSRASALQISIHAPAWGRLLDRIFAVGQLRISIHAPAWGRPQKTARKGGRYDFNPRPRVGATLGGYFVL